MVKLRNKERLAWAIRQYERGKGTFAELAGVCNVSARRFRQVYSFYARTGSIPVIGKNLGRPKTVLSPAHRTIILETYRRYLLNAVYLEKVIYAEQGIRIPHNTIHSVLLQEKLAIREPNKSKRRKKWIRYERAHSLSAGHLDWHIPADGPPVCVVLDDASRKILSGGEFEEATAAHSIELVQQVIDRYGSIRTLRETITDHGTQFYANKRDEDGYAAHEFELYVKEQGIKHILCRYNHPQSNGKIERWFGLYKKHRKRFKTFNEFIDWYNNRPHGSLNLRRAETPEQAFWRKMIPEYYYHLAAKYFNW